VTRSRLLCTAALFAALSACAGAPRATLRGVVAGAFVEAKGHLVDGRPLVHEIDEITRGADDKADKLEVTGPVEHADGERLRLLGHDFALGTEVEYEDAEKRATAPFVPATGDWLRVKARRKDELLRARTLRQLERREQFKVTGEVLAVDGTGATLDVGGLRLPVAQGVALSPLSQARADDPLQLFLGEDQKAVPFTLKLGDRVSIGGQAATEFEWNDEFDLDRGNEGDRQKPQVRGRLASLWLLDDAGSYALGEITFGRDDTWREGGDDTHNDVLELSRAFLSWNAADSVQLLAGRQDFDEEREWLYDEVLDGVRAIWRQGRCEFELGIAQGRDFAAEENRNEDTGLLLANVRCWVDPDWRLGAYVLQVTDDSAAGFEPTLFGVRSLAQPRYGLGHWFELGAARGDAGNREIDGWAFDVGGLYTFDLPLRPSVGAGIAFGSGERDSSRTSGYRQTSLQDNNAKLGGVTSLRYYGELLDPELANLTVTTLCASIRPFDGGSLTLLLHSYRQDAASAAIPDTALRTTPNGLSRDLGTEIDLVLGYRLDSTLTVEVIASRFEPGAAFAGDEAAHLFVFTTRLSF
jgi:hypothetical protein